MNPFYDLNKRLAGIGQDKQQVAESKKQEVKSPARKTLEESLRSDMKSLMEGSKPDFLDADKDGNKKEPMKKAMGDKTKNPFAKKEEKVEEDASAGMAQGATLEAKTKSYSAKNAAAGKDIGKPGKNFAKIEKSAAKKYGSKEAGEKVAGAVLNKLRTKESAGEKADKDYDKDGKVESPKAEYMGARIAAGKKAAQKMKEQIAPEEEMDEAGLPDVADKKAKMATARGNKPSPLKNVGKGIKAFFKGEPEPMDEEQEMLNFLQSKVGKAKSKPYNGTPKSNASNGMAREGVLGKAGGAVGAEVGAGLGNMVVPGVGGAIGGAIGKAAGTSLGNKAADTIGMGEGDEMTLEAVSRKHFQQVADLLRNIEDPVKRKEMAQHHAEIFAQQNPRFDTGRFFQAAGIDEGMGCDSTMDEGFDEMDAWLKQREAEKGTGKFDKRKVSTGTVYTRKPETFGDEPSSAPADGVKRGRGRPKKMSEDGCCPHCGGPITPEGEIDEEMAEAGKRHFFDKLAPAAKKAAKIVKKVTNGRKEVDEESTEKEDKKAEKAGKKVTKDIEADDKKDKKEKKEGNPFAKKDKKEEKVEETTTAGSVATASTSGKSNGMGIGQGVYESMNAEFNRLLKLNESINVSQNAAKMEDGNEEESITINVTGDDVSRFKELLSNMGLGGGQEPAGDEHDFAVSGEEPCGSCGGVPCQCDDQMDCGDMGLPGEVEFEVVEAGDVEEDITVSMNSPDYPSNQEYDNDALQYAGGLNKPKSTGQSTVPVLASQEERQVAEGSDQRFFSLVKSILAK